MGLERVKAICAVAAGVMSFLASCVAVWVFLRS